MNKVHLLYWLLDQATDIMAETGIPLKCDDALVSDTFDKMNQLMGNMVKKYPELKQD